MQRIGNQESKTNTIQLVPCICRDEANLYFSITDPDKEKQKSGN
ncbi:MAG: hypothetical protein AB7O47_07120 [Flavobacteriales bacterium]